jgi:aryl-alcohol dehydrogenase-like predicted oxidoreductase
MKMYMNDRGFRILSALDVIAGKYRTKPASVALAWLMARPHITAPIASATSVEQLQDLIAATRLTLDQASLELLNAASAEHAIAA